MNEIQKEVDALKRDKEMKPETKTDKMKALREKQTNERKNHRHSLGNIDKDLIDLDKKNNDKLRELTGAADETK